jgi:hypothetical protein
LGFRGQPLPPLGIGHSQRGGFILTSNDNGCDSLTLKICQFFGAATLQQALTDDGIPALVKSGSVCTSSPLPPPVLDRRLPETATWEASERAPSRPSTCDHTGSTPIRTAGNVQAGSISISHRPREMLPITCPRCRPFLLTVLLS